MSLQEIGRENGTDKATHHRYLPLYELLFRHLKDKPIRILEVGIQFGNSLRTWAEYFPDAWVLGIDCVDNGTVFTPKEQIEVVYHNAYDPETIQWIGDQHFDIMIDDGSHRPEDQEWFLQHYHPLLAKGGVLIVEDVLSFNNALELVMARPVGFQHTVVEMTEGNSVVDSRLFIMWKD